MWNDGESSLLLHKLTVLAVYKKVSLTFASKPLKINILYHRFTANFKVRGNSIMNL